MRIEAREFGLANGHSPIADKVVCVDFDGTLYPWGELFSYAAPLPGAVTSMKELKASGFRIVIFTSRLSPTWLFAEGESASEQKEYITKVLTRDGIPFDDITSEKIPAIAYVDDKAVNYHGYSNEWKDIANWLVARHGSA